MAIVPLTPVDVLRSGVATSYTGSLSTSNTYTVAISDHRTFLHFKKSGAGICAVTVITPGTSDGFAVADLTFNVPASTGDVMAGPFRLETFADPVTGLLSFTCSDIAGLSVGVFHLVSS